MPDQAMFHVLVPQANAWTTPLFTYSAPPDLAEQIAPGQSVLVPFGARLTLGIVWSEATPSQSSLTPEQIRSIHQLLDPVPLLDSPRRALAEWLAEAYVCSLVDAIRMIVPGLTSAPRIDLIAAPAGDGAPATGTGDDPEIRALLGLLRQRGSIDERVIHRALGPRKAGMLIAELEARGALTRAVHTAAEHVGPRDAILSLTADPDTIAAWRDEIVARLTAPAPPNVIPLRPRRIAPPAPRGKRSRGAFLQQIAGSTVPAPMVPASPLLAPDISPREAVRLRGALAIVDLLLATPDIVRTRREALRLTRATPAALAIAMRDEIVAVADPAGDESFSMRGSDPLVLNPAQQAALDQIVAAMDAAVEASLLPPGIAVPEDLERLCRPILLHGVTGSGKTEVYLQALAAACECGRRGIVLVPEIALTPQTVSRFAQRFPGRVALLHSALKPAERLREWERIRSGAVDVVVGSRSAIFAPMPDLGLIILDEEHDSSYKHDQRPPTYHAREVAFALARLTGAAVILGSATPSTESYHRALQGDFALAELPDRAVDVQAHASPVAPALPPVTIVDLRAELQAGHTSILSRELLAGMEQTLKQGEQTILFLNRRGSATCVLCRDCGYVVRCGRCDVPLTHHQSEAALICHYCNWRERPPKICLRCGGSGIRFFGIGTERVEATVRERFPHARVLRWDADTVRQYTDHERFARALAQHEVDILIGTQMIAKGLDVPSVTLVGVIAADIALYLPDYRAPERAFQLLTQVAGRAGRGASPGRVILQTFSPDHFCVEAAARHDYRAFYDVEIVTRQAYRYPPFRRFVKMTYTHKDRHACQIEAISLGDHLTRLIADLGLPDTDIVGPAPAFIERLRNTYRWQMIVRGPDPRAVIAALAPGELGPGWTIDIDPLSSL